MLGMSHSGRTVLGTAKGVSRVSRLNQKPRRLLIAKQSAARARAEVVGSGTTNAVNLGADTPALS